MTDEKRTCFLSSSFFVEIIVVPEFKTLNVEPEMHDIAFAHHVFFAFES